MKKLIAVSDIKEAFARKEKVCFLEPGTIITPAARDTAAEFGIILKIGNMEVEECKDVAKEVVKTETAPKSSNEESGLLEEIKKVLSESYSGINESLVCSIVQEVLKRLPEFQNKDGLIKEVDRSGAKLVRGASITLERFDTGNASDKVGIKDIFSSRESPNMGAGLMTIEKSSFPWTLNYDELDYVLEGELEISINGRTYTGCQGDVFYIPKGTSIIFGSSNYCKFYYTTYPANWADLSK